MTMPQWLADAIARLAQRGPGPRLGAAVAFADIPARTEPAAIPTRHGDVAATLYLPEGGAAGKPVVVNLHGGGFVLRHPEQDDGLCRFLAAKADAVVVNVDYDVAPGLRFPGPVEEAYDAAVWAASPERPWDGSRLAVAGSSAGGALAAGAARLALEQGRPAIRLQLLHYPPLDLSVPARSKLAPGKERFLARMGPVFDAAYAPGTSASRTDRLVSPAGPADTAPLAGIAPAVVVTCGRDILREEAVRYAGRLRAAGALVEHIDLEGAGHGYNLLGRDTALVTEVYRRLAARLREALAPPSGAAAAGPPAPSA